MTTITLQIENQEDVNLILQLAAKIGVASVTEEDDNKNKLGFKNRKEFYEAFGMGKKKPLTFEKIREKAWQRKK